METVGANLYLEEEIYSILCEKSNAEIISEYSLSDLKRCMHLFIKKSRFRLYKRKDSECFTK